MKHFPHMNRHGRFEMNIYCVERLAKEISDISHKRRTYFRDRFLDPTVAIFSFLARPSLLPTATAALLPQPSSIHFIGPLGKSL